eukprot:CAMPEP_0179024044 /NCGR_PEP_ID=MMETSP0796-20121207/7249_1 /TAXON_ID=73915 /ORGANISM="Pyrodinium bahamense, Strain pbaha01" /LENGTH=581 /DNA_ID=CAMNT_0020719987 /DNA_START=34 /DNA_END=1777 /DNA_ORIENTATION=+
MFGLSPMWPLAMQGVAPSMVQTQQPDRGAGDASSWYETYRRIKTLKSKRSLWRLRQEKPELFAQQQEAHLGEHESAVPRGFGPCDRDGWLYNSERRVYLEQSTGRRCWLDETTRTYQDLYEGDVMPFVFASGAATRQGAQGSSCTSAPPGSRGKSSTPSAASGAGPRHVAIPDLHRAAEALKVDLDHLDRPAAMLAVFCARADAAPADASACALHSKLLRRLGAFRGEWADVPLQAAVAGALDDLAADHGGARPSGAVALAIGERVVIAAAPGAHGGLAVRPGAPAPTASSPPAEPAATVPAALPPALLAPPRSGPTAVACRVLVPAPTAQELHVVLVAGELGGSGPGAGGMAAADPLAVTSPHLLLGRPRAASVALLRTLREQGTQGQLAVGCARLGLHGVGSEAAARPLGPAAKRQRTGEPSGKVRARQILLRHAGSSRPMDPVRKKAVQRSLEEAELEMLDVLARLEADGCAGFAGACRAHSECQSALKGGELAGDLGWLDCSVAKSADAQQEKGKAAVRPQVPASVLKAASALELESWGTLSALSSVCIYYNALHETCWHTSRHDVMHYEEAVGLAR